MKPTPPKSVLNFLRWFCREDYLEEIEGDLTEVFEKQYEHSPAKARRTFTWSVIRYFRPGFIKAFKTYYHQNTTVMFRHNLLITYRNFKRYKSSFLINLISLSTGLACVLLIYLWVNDELSIDKFHENDSRLYQVMENVQINDGIETRNESSGPLAELLMEEMPDVEYSVAVAPTRFPGFDNFDLSVDEINIKAAGQYVGKEYFNIFSYELIYGDKSQVLTDKNSIVISEELATKLFNTTQDIIGKAIEFQHERQFLVSGIFKQIPSNSSVQFDFALSFETLKEISPWVASWGSTGPRVYAVLKQGTDVKYFNKMLAKLIKLRFDQSMRTPFLSLYSDQYLFGNYKNGVQAGGRIEYVRLFSVVAIFILLIACINFMNLSTARASRRLKEIGVKKAVGSGRMELFVQHFGESTLMVLMALAIAVLFVALFLPSFNEITGKHFILSFDGALILSILTIAVFTGTVAGIYPALYLSGFKTINTLKGKLNPSLSGVWARKGLVVFQFTVSIILIVSVWVVYKQIEFVLSQNLGFNRENVVYFDVGGELKVNTESFVSEIKRIPGVLNASGTGHRIVGHNWSSTGLGWEGKDPDDRTSIEIVVLNYDLIETLGIEIKEGRSFSRDFGADTTKIILNEAAVNAIDIEEPIGGTIDLMGRKEIIGVVKNYHFESFHQEIKPMVFILSPGSENKIMVKLESGMIKESLGKIQSSYEKFNPGFVFNYRFLDDDYQALYVAEQRVSALSQYFAGMAILISCLGLFGLAAFTAERRMKEIGIRKILGSGEFGIVRLLSADFTKMVLIAVFIALPLSYLIASKWLESFAYRIDLKWFFFLGAGFVALLIAWLTVGLQTIKAARVNPVECLKDE